VCATPYADSQAACEALQAQFVKRYSPLAPKAVERLGAEWERVVTFDQVPQGHRRHLRTTPVVESPVAAVRLRPTAATRVKKVDAATARIWKMRQVAEGTFRRLNAPEWLPAVFAGAKYVDGIKQRVVNHQEAAAWSHLHTYWQDLHRMNLIVKRPWIS
jgi:hypothetical protein